MIDIKRVVKMEKVHDALDSALDNIGFPKTERFNIYRAVGLEIDNWLDSKRTEDGAQHPEGSDAATTATPSDTKDYISPLIDLASVIGTALFGTGERPSPIAIAQAIEALIMSRIHWHIGDVK